MISRVLIAASVGTFTAASLAACGSSGNPGAAATTSHPAPISTHVGRSSTPSDPSRSSPSVGSTGSAQGVGLVLTTNELPSGSGSWQVARQGVFNSASPDSGQRVWVSSDHKGLEVDVIGTGATAAAKAAYPAWRTHVAANTLSHIKTMACSTGAPPDCAIKTGTTADGKNEVVLSFQHLSALVAVVIASQGSVDANIVQQIGYAELKHLDAVLGGGAPAPAGSSAAGNAGFAVPVTDAATAAHVLADQAKGSRIKNGSLTVWQNDGLTLNGYAIPATPTSISGSVYFVTSKSRNVDYLAIAVKDTNGNCAGGVLEANKNTTAVTKTTVFPTVSGSCTGAGVGARAGY